MRACVRGKAKSPHQAVGKTAARLRFLLNLNGCGWMASLGAIRPRERFGNSLALPRPYPSGTPSWRIAARLTGTVPDRLFYGRLASHGRYGPPTRCLPRRDRGVLISLGSSIVSSRLVAHADIDLPMDTLRRPNQLRSLRGKVPDPESAETPRSGHNWRPNDSCCCRLSQRLSC